MQESNPQGESANITNQSESKKKIVIVVIVFVLLFLCCIVAGVLYWFLNKDKDTTNDDTDVLQESCDYNGESHNDGDSFETDDGCNTCSCTDGSVSCTEMACESTTTTTTTTALFKLDPNLQEIITNKCVKVGNDNAYAYYISADDLPISLVGDELVFFKVNDSDYEGICMTGDLLGNQGAISFYYKDSDGNEQVAEMHDENSVELGHGGAPYLGEFGEVIYEGDDYQISVYIMCSDTCGGSVGEYSATIRARRTLNYLNGEKIYINSDFILFEQGDQKFEQFLDDYMKSWNGTQIVDSEEAEDNIVDKYFSDLGDLENPEKEVYERALVFIHAIDYKK